MFEFFFIGNELQKKRLKLVIIHTIYNNKTNLFNLHNKHNISIIINKHKKHNIMGITV